jgi:hypothetical protein
MLFERKHANKMIALTQSLRLQYHTPPLRGIDVLLDKKDKQRVHMLDMALRFARSRLTPDITAQRLLILISVFQNEGMNQRELLKTLDSTSITALSRNLADRQRAHIRKTLADHDGDPLTA